jgi:hypothetical protein
MSIMLSPKDGEIKRKRSITFEIPTFTDIKSFFNTKIKVLRNKTIEGMDWLREKLASIDMEKNSTTGGASFDVLDEIRKNDDNTILSLIKGDKNLGERIRDLFQNTSQPAAEWLNDILIAKEDDNNKIVFFNETQQNVQNSLGDNKIKRKRRSAASMFKGLLGRSKASTSTVPSTTILETTAPVEVASSTVMIERMASLDENSSGNKKKQFNLF